jgi:hypothetical protein
MAACRNRKSGHFPRHIPISIHHTHHDTSRGSSVPHYRTLPIAIILSITTLTFLQLRKSEKNTEFTKANSKQDTTTTRDTISTQELDSLGIDERMILSDGEQDIRNQYAHTVTTEAITPSGDSIRCSGVVISPNVVLTAGHCVCMNHKPTTAQDGIDLIIDSSQCIPSASITTALYNLQSTDAENHESTQKKTYTGKTKPHPNLKIPFNEQGIATSSNSDLALIFLDKPVQNEIPTVSIASQNIQVGDLITLVGYGYNATSDIIYGIRRFGKNKVTKLSTPETVLFEQQDSKGFTSGSGEPCLHKAGENTFIVGITGEDINGTPTFTNVHIHKTWIDAELQNHKNNTPETHHNKSHHSTLHPPKHP